VHHPGGNQQRPGITLSAIAVTSCRATSKLPRDEHQGRFTPLLHQERRPPSYASREDPRPPAAG